MMQFIFKFFCSFSFFFIMFQFFFNLSFSNSILLSLLLVSLIDSWRILFSFSMSFTLASALIWDRCLKEDTVWFRCSFSCSNILICLSEFSLSVSIVFQAELSPSLDPCLNSDNSEDFAFLEQSHFQEFQPFTESLIFFFNFQDFGSIAFYRIHSGPKLFYSFCQTLIFHL